MLVINLREGDYVMIGENIRIHFDHPDGKDQIALGIEAPKEVGILRGKIYEEGIAKLADEGDQKAIELSERLRVEHKERRKRANKRKARQEYHSGRFARAASV